MNHNLLVIDDRIYLDARMGVTWPGPSNPGYICVFGMEDGKNAMAKRPVHFLKEVEEADRKKLFEIMVGLVKEFGCSAAYALGGKDYQAFIDGFTEYCRSRNFSGLSLWDASDISGFETGRTIAADLARAKALKVPRGTKLRSQIEAITPDDCRTKNGLKAHERFPAAAAMNHVLASYEYYPPRKRKRQSERRPTEGYR